MASWLARLDEAVARVERVLILAFLAVMSLVVFFDVVFRNWTSPQGVLIKAMAWLTGRPLTDGLLDTIDEPVAGLILFVFVFAALKSAASGGTFGSNGGAAAGAGIRWVVRIMLLSVVLFLDVIVQRWTQTESLLVDLLFASLFAVLMLSAPIRRLGNAGGGPPGTRWLVLLIVISLVGFLDLLVRHWTQTYGVLVALLATLLRLNESALGTLDGGFAGITCIVVLFAMLMSAGRFGTNRGAAAGAFGAAVAAGSGLRLLVLVFPNGLVWSQPFALALLLWVALVGASLATKAKAHIVLEVADRIWPASIHPFVKVFSGVGAGLFSFGLVALGIHFTGDFYDQWSEFGTQKVQGTPLPLWVVYGAIPVSFAVIGTRFTAYAIGDFLHRHDKPTPLAEEVRS